MNPKYIRIFSDIHLDFDIPNKLKNFDPDKGLWTPNFLPTDSETILILAGDIWHAKKPFSFAGFSWFKKIAPQFHSVIVLLGNHDFWAGNLKTEYENYEKSIIEQNLKNVFLMQNKTLCFDGIKFIGGTLWTDFNNFNQSTLSLATENMNDFRYIKNGVGFTKLKPVHLVPEFRQTLNYIELNRYKDYPEQKLWVLTHHAPTTKSLHPDFKDDDFFHQNGLYASNLERLFDNQEDNQQIDVWVHGHTHQFYYYKINNTKIIANPRGYTFEDTNFMPNAVFDFQGKLIAS